MRILILGGTKFLGRAITEAALARGHQLTLFNRGETNPELFPEAERLRGDRTSDLSALEGRTWDAVIDPSGYVPAVVRASAEQLHGDRKRDLSLLSGRTWEAVIDPSGYIPADVRASAEQLGDAGRGASPQA